jgi:hypothetical protein
VTEVFDVHRLKELCGGIEDLVIATAAPILDRLQPCALKVRGSLLAMGGFRPDLREAGFSLVWGHEEPPILLSDLSPRGSR